ncbi:hypothetical protein RI845_04905 [Thalassotalea nanhaiensis]|uniref:DUF2244 domain-containing protein n=1 Tax=Thalassotalea nanhaiensis TaxID=3065648 RepID=A0ABY9TL61_9GAMM|nr:hypothetical protein RI845_04905 [Colwelliaceae bacterium SQ345]
MLQEFKPKPYVTPQGHYLSLVLISLITAIVSLVLGYLVFINIVQLLCFILFAMVWAARHHPSLIITDTEIISRNSHTVYWHFPVAEYAHIKRIDKVTLLVDEQGQSYETANSNFTEKRWQEIEEALNMLT